MAAPSPDVTPPAITITPIVEPPKPGEMTFDDFKKKIINQDISKPAGKPLTPIEILKKRGVDAIDPAAKPEEKPVEEPKVEAAKPTEEPAKPEPEKPTEPAKKPVKRTIKVAKGYEASPEDMARITAAATTAATKAVLEAKPATPPAPKVDEQEFNEEEKEQLQVLAQLEEDRPELYKGIAGRAKDFMADVTKLETTFRQSWEAQNPADKFDSDAERRAAFDAAQGNEVERLRRQHKVDWNKSHFDKAAVRLEVKPVVERNKQLESKVAQMESEREIERVELPAQKIASSSVKDVLGEIVGDTAKTMMNDKGFDAVAAEDADPVAAPVLANAAAIASDFAAKCFKAFKGVGSQDDFDRIEAACKAIEAGILQSGEEVQLDTKGRQFVGKIAYQRMSKDMKELHWTLDAPTAIAHMNNLIIEDAKVRIESERKRADKIIAKMGGKTAAPATVTTTGTPISTPPAKSNVKPVSPTTTATPPSPDKTATQKGNGFFDTFFGGVKPPSLR